MPISQSARLLVIVAMLFFATTASALELAAPYVPTAPTVVDRMLQVAKVGPGDYVIDLGSGDGRINITAARKYGATGLGVDVDAELVAKANAAARAAGVADRVLFVERDLFETDISQATVVTIYLLNRALRKLRPKLLAELRPGTRIVSHAAGMDDWKPERFEMMDVPDKVRPDAPGRTYIYLWVVPAQAAGTWRWTAPVGGRAQDYELVLEQKFQMLSGTVRAGGREAPVENAKLDGERIALEFTLPVDGRPVRHRLSGRVRGEAITGAVSFAGDRVAGEAEWDAARVARPAAEAAAAR